MPDFCDGGAKRFDTGQDLVIHILLRTIYANLMVTYMIAQTWSGSAQYQYMDKMIVNIELHILYVILYEYLLLACSSCERKNYFESKILQMS